MKIKTIKLNIKQENDEVKFFCPHCRYWHVADLGGEDLDDLTEGSDLCCNGCGKVYRLRSCESAWWGDYEWEIQL